MKKKKTNTFATAGFDFSPLSFCDVRALARRGFPVKARPWRPLLKGIKVDSVKPERPYAGKKEKSCYEIVAGETPCSTSDEQVKLPFSRGRTSSSALSEESQPGGAPSRNLTAISSENLPPPPASVSRHPSRCAGSGQREWPNFLRSFLPLFARVPWTAPFGAEQDDNSESIRFSLTPFSGPNSPDKARTILGARRTGTKGPTTISCLNCREPAGLRLPPATRLSIVALPLGKKLGVRATPNHLNSPNGDRLPRRPGPEERVKLMDEGKK